MYGSSGGDPRAAVAAVKAAFASAVKRAPSVVILDDLDAVAGATYGDGPGGGQSVPAGETVSEIIADAIDATMHLGVVTLATCSSPESVHVAVRAAGRLDHECELRSPDAVAGREAVVTAHAAARGTPVLGADVASTAAIDAEGYARGDLTTLVERAAHAAAARSMRSTSAVTVEDSGKLGHADFKDASVGLVPAPARALGGGSGSTLNARNEDGDEDPLVRVGGLVDVKAALDDALSLPSRHPAIFGNAPLRLRTGVLLYGPPGCGKTMIIASAIKSAGLRAVSIKGPELLNKYIGQSEAGVRDAFRRAAAAAPCALFFDEFDSIAPRRGHDSTGEFIFIFGYFWLFLVILVILVIFGYFWLFWLFPYGLLD
jgi:peroxin-1